MSAMKLYIKPLNNIHLERLMLVKFDSSSYLKFASIYGYDLSVYISKQQNQISFQISVLFLLIFTSWFVCLYIVCDRNLLVVCIYIMLTYHYVAWQENL